MEQPFIGPEALDAGGLTRGQLRWRYTAVHPRVYVPNDSVRTIFENARAAWLWTDRRGIIAGRAASALHGASWVDDATPVEVIAEHGRPRRGVIVREERVAPDEICMVGDLRVTTPARTALDLARHQPRDAAVAHLDALAAATHVSSDDVLALAERFRGARGIRRARTAIELMDAGSQSPRETWLRMMLIDAGYEPPRTQIRVSDGRRVAFIDMGYDELKIGLDYEGVHHSEDRGQYLHDIGRGELVNGQGWIDILVVKEHSRRFILQRVRDAFVRRGGEPPPTSTPRS